MNYTSIETKLKELNNREMFINSADFLSNDDKQALKQIEQEKTDLKNKIKQELETLDKKESRMLFGVSVLTENERVEVNLIYMEQRKLKKLLEY